MARQPSQRTKNKKARKRFEVVGASPLRREQQEHDIDRLAVDRIEIDRLGKPRKDSDDAFKARNFAMRDGNTLAKSGRAEPLALEQHVEDDAFG